MIPSMAKILVLFSNLLCKEGGVTVSVMKKLIILGL